MQYSSIILIAAYAVTNIFAHGLPVRILGDNGVEMPGLSVIDDTPRDCGSPRCGSEKDTAIIRKRELGTNKASALGRTQGGGPIQASKMVMHFMSPSGNETATKEARAIHAASMHRRSLVPRAANGGTKTPKGTVETGVKAAAGAGMSSGLPTCSENGMVKITYHQVNQDGAGPLTAMVDGTSGGTDPAAFKTAQVMQNVPGIGIGGLSAAAVMDFPVEVKMPEGMTCDATVGNAQNVCIIMLKNNAAAGPFGGSLAVTQSPGAKKRAIEYNLRKRNFARALVKKGQQDDVASALANLEAVGSATKPEDGVVEKRQAPKDGLEDGVAAALASLEAAGSATKSEDGVVEKREAPNNGPSKVNEEDEEDEDEEDEEED